MIDKLSVLYRRMQRLGIHLQFVGNYPWIYLHEVNGKRVTERYLAEHGFTIAWHPIRVGEELKLTDTKEIFKVIRKYR